MQWLTDGVRRRLVPVVAVGLLVVAACGGGGGDDGASEATTTTVGESSTTTEATTTSTTVESTDTTTFAQADEPPTLVNTGEDFDAIVRSLSAFGEWLSVHPDADRLAEAYRVGSPGYDALHPAFVDFETRGLHTDGATPGEINLVQVATQVSPDVVLLYLEITNHPYLVLDASGAVVEQRPGNPRTAWTWELRRGDTGRWLIENRTVIGEV